MLMVVGALVWMLSCGGVATAFDFHADSAHGNTTYGVNRPGTGYSTGDCANCHETFDSSICGVNNYMLFHDDYVGLADNFCFECHRTNDIGYGVVVNYPYCVNFGGDVPTFYQSIKKQFTNDYSKPANCGSRHYLLKIRNIVKDNAYVWGFNSDPDPCVTCHPPHAAQRNHPVVINGEGKLNTAIRRPSHYKSTDSQDLLWGDDTNERMNAYASSVGGTYQAPYYGDTSGTKFEPSGNGSPSDGSDLPNYVTFCLDCHQDQLADPERGGATVTAIDWTSEIHGAALANTCDSDTEYEGTTKAPYTNPNANYVLSCLDCHEPHGTKKRLHLIRRMINGQDVALDSPDARGECEDYLDKAAICTPCHDWPHPTWGGCYGCHRDEVDFSGFHGSIFVEIEDLCQGEPGF